MKYEIEIKEIGDKEEIKRFIIQAPDPDLAYDWGKVQAKYLNMKDSAVVVKWSVEQKDM